MKFLFSTLTLLLMLSACNQAPTPSVPSAQTPPSWIHGAKGGAVGMCATHMKGNAVQESVAMDRAIEKLAKQKESTVETSSVSSQNESAGSYNSSYNSNTTVKANAKVSAHIEATWRNPYNNNYYILMKMD